MLKMVLITVHLSAMYNLDWSLVRAHTAVAKAVQVDQISLRILAAADSL